MTRRFFSPLFIGSHFTDVFLALGGVLMGVAIATPGHADTLYKCTESSGVVLYTNQKSSAKNCTILSRDLPITSLAAPPRSASRYSSTSTPTPGNFPRIDNDTQRSRDTDRRKILEQEYATEQQNLEKAKQALTEGEVPRAPGEKNTPKYLDRVKYLRDGVALHERNLDALKRELANLK